MTNPSSSAPTPDRAAASSSSNALDTLGALHATFAHAPMGLLVLGGTLRVISINGALASLFGVSPAGVSGRPAAEAFPEAWETLGELCARVLGGQPVANAECPLTAPAGLRGRIVCQLSVNRVLHGDELAGLEFVHAVELEREVIEGSGHTGVGVVVQFIARKPG